MQTGPDAPPHLALGQLHAWAPRDAAESGTKGQGAAGDARGPADAARCGQMRKINTRAGAQTLLLHPPSQFLHLAGWGPRPGRWMIPQAQTDGPVRETAGGGSGAD